MRTIKLRTIFYIVVDVCSTLQVHIIVNVSTIHSSKASFASGLFKYLKHVNFERWNEICSVERLIDIH